MHRKQILRIGLLYLFFLSAFSEVISLGYAESEHKDSIVESSDFPVVSEILVTVQEIYDSETEWITLAKNLIFLKEGERFSENKLQDSIKALKGSNLFQEIHIDSKEEKETIRLFFHLKLFRQIKDIKVGGGFPLFEREIINAMTIYIGDAFIPEELPKQKALIEELFRQQGFKAPRAEVTAKQDPKDGHFVVSVKIDKGPFYRLDRLEIIGNHFISDTRLKFKMKTRQVSLLPGSSGRFVEKNLKSDIKKLIQYYRKKRHPDCVIDYRIEKDSEKNKVSVFVTIDEGPRYRIEFEGNETFWNYTLKKHLVLFKEGNKKDMGIKRSVKKIKAFYRMAGFLETRVNVEEKRKTDGEKTIRTLRFVVQEGPCSIVDSIQISGNKAFDDEKIKRQMITRLPGFLKKGAFVPETLKDDLVAIRSLYRRHGYRDVEVKEHIKWSNDKRTVGVNLKIDEKVQTLIASVKISGITILSEKEAYEAILLKAGEPFREYMIQSDENRLSALISEKGYPHVRVKGEVSISEDGSEAGIVYRVDEESFVKMGQVWYKGNFRTQKRILENELEMKPEDPFSLAKMLRGQRNLRNMNIFNSVRFKTIGLKEKKEKVALFVEVEEKKNYFVELGGGYETQRGFFVHTKGGDYNLFGTNKSAWLGVESSQIGYRGEAAITEPRLFGSRTSANLSVFTERREEFNQDFGTRIHGASLGFTRKFFQKISTGLNFNFEYRDQFRRDSAKVIYDSDEFEPRSVLVAKPSIVYDSRDSFIRPQKGLFSSFSVDISNGIQNSVDNFFKYRVDLRYFLTPFRRVTFACLGRAGYIDPYGDMPKVPDDQLFFLGGTSDVRGFDENLLRFDADGDPMGGCAMISGSLETRIDMGRKFELALFYDVGSLTDNFSEMDSENLRSSIGAGLRYITPIGPIGFLYGIKLDRKQGESSGRFHFSIGYTF